MIQGMTDAIHLLIAGAGGVGGYFGGLVAAEGGDVTYLGRGAHGEAIRARGLVVRTGGREIASRPGVVLPGAAIPPPDAVILAVKHRDLASALAALRPILRPGLPVLSLLNGIGHDKDIRDAFPGARVLLGTAFLGASIESPGVILHTSEGRIAFGEAEGAPSDDARAIERALARGGFPVRLVEDVRPILWRKLLWNASFNCLNTIEGGTCADLMRDTAKAALLREIMEEIAGIARAEGIRFEADWIEKSMTAAVNFTPYVTSMRLDRERGRALEILPILARPIEAADRRGLPVPRLREILARLCALP